MVSVALEIKVNKFDSSTDKNKTNYKITEEVISKIKKNIDLAINKRGSYYLPYYKIATIEQFKAAYPKYPKWEEQADIWNPIISKDKNRLFSNEFLKEYLNQLN
jgi:hypothetical protein